jgi:hypothetical protein
MLHSYTLFIFFLYGPDSPNDLAILRDLYDNTNGPSWSYQDRWWEAGLSMCYFGGIVCDCTQGLNATPGCRVTEIHLTESNLTGTLPVNNSKPLRHVILGL